MGNRALSRGLLDYYETAEWEATRRAKLIQVDYRCERCGATDQPLDVHHKPGSYARLGIESLDDLEALCRPCHDAEPPQGPRFRRLPYANRHKLLLECEGQVRLFDRFEWEWDDAA